MGWVRQYNESGVSYSWQQIWDCAPTMDTAGDCSRGVNPRTFFSGLFVADSDTLPVFVQQPLNGHVMQANASRCLARPNATRYVVRALYARIR